MTLEAKLGSTVGNKASQGPWKQSYGRDPGSDPGSKVVYSSVGEGKLARDPGSKTVGDRKLARDPGSKTVGEGKLGGCQHLETRLVWYCVVTRRVVTMVLFK